MGRYPPEAIIRTFVAVAAGQLDLVAAVASKKIRILAIAGQAVGTGTIQLSDANLAITGLMKLNDGTGFVWPFNDEGWGETGVGLKLSGSLGGAMTSFDGVLVYVLV